MTNKFKCGNYKKYNHNFLKGGIKMDIIDKLERETDLLKERLEQSTQKLETIMKMIKEIRAKGKEQQVVGNVEKLLEIVLNLKFHHLRPYLSTRIYNCLVQMGFSCVTIGRLVKQSDEHLLAIGGFHRFRQKSLEEFNTTLSNIGLAPEVRAQLRELKEE